MISTEELENLRIKTASDIMKIILSNLNFYKLYEDTADQLNEEVESVIASDAVSFSNELIRKLGYEVPTPKIPADINIQSDNN